MLKNQTLSVVVVVIESHSVVVAIEIVEKSNSFSSCRKYRKLLKNQTLSVVIVESC